MIETECILVVDDNEAGRYIKVRTLARAGFNVLMAGDGRNALSLVTAEKPCVVVLDVKLPDMSGLDVCRRIKQIDPSIFVLQTSATFTGQVDRARGFEGGADSYLVEPMEPSELVAAAESLLRLRRAERALRKSHDELERKVAERTHELAAANEQLRREIAQRTAAEDALRHTQRMDILGQLTGGIAHDFNNLLAIIQGNIESLRRRLGPETSQFRAFVDNAYYGARRAANLTHQLLAFARRQPLTPRPLELTALAAELIPLTRQTLGERVKVVAQIAPDLWPVYVDQGEFEAAILNLIMNARDAMEAGGEIVLKMNNFIAQDQKEPDGMTAGDYVAIAVADAGAGMDQNIIKYVFEPFFTTKDVGQGTGLGLSQVHGFVTAASGRAAIDSVVGRGTTVTLYLPRYRGQLSPTKASESAVALRARSSATILVVEDDHHVRAHTVAMVQDLGYLALQAVDAKTALEVLETNTVDLMFSDIGLPGGMDGPSLALRAQASYSNLKILLTTAYGRPSGEMPNHAFPVMLKPYTYAELGQKLRELLPPKTGQRLLLVEDEPLIRIDAAEALRELGFDVEEATSAGQAMERVGDDKHPIDAMIIDLGLPDRSGDDLASDVRAQWPLLSIIIASGYANEQVYGRFKSDQHLAFIDKPYNAAQVQRALNELRGDRTM